MTREEFTELVRLGCEAPGLEFKPPARRDDVRVGAEVVRAAMALANRRGGGRIVIGVAEDQKGKALVPVGLTIAELTTWNRDDLSSLLAQYAEPMIEFEQTTLEVDGKQYVIVDIQEFRHTPILCGKTVQHQGKTILRVSALYVRGRRKPESLEVSTYEEMREVIDLAIEKGVQRFAEQLRQAGMLAPVAPSMGAEDKYDEELEGLL
ncbi:MAG TPA: ATP-binding protein [Chloroflexota bacterium]|jgi:predicted HTH transcriptional regulator